MAVRVGQGWRLVVDGYDISHLVRGFTVNTCVSGITTMDVEFLAHDLTMDSDGTVRIGTGPAVRPEKPPNVRRSISLDKVPDPKS